MRKLAVSIYVACLRTRTRFLKAFLKTWLSVTKRQEFIWKTQRRAFRVSTPPGELADNFAQSLLGDYHEFEALRDTVATRCSEDPVVFVVGSNIGLNELPLSDMKGPGSSESNPCLPRSGFFGRTWR